MNNTLKTKDLRKTLYYYHSCYHNYHHHLTFPEYYLTGLVLHLYEQSSISRQSVIENARASICECPVGSTVLELQIKGKRDT